MSLYEQDVVQTWVMQLTAELERHKFRQEKQNRGSKTSIINSTC